MSLGECIEWKRGKCNQGYGRRWYKGTYWGAHRAALDEIGILDPTKIVMHLCDNPSCINIKHLIQGTQKDNMQDKVKKGRTYKGLYLYDGKQKTLLGWSKDSGIPFGTLTKRLYRQKWTFEKAITTSTRKYTKRESD